MTQFAQVVSIDIPDNRSIQKVEQGALRTKITLGDCYGKTIATLTVEDPLWKVCTQVDRNPPEGSSQ